MEKSKFNRFNNNVKKDDGLKTYSTIENNEYYSYKIEIDKVKLSSLKDKFIELYSDYETVTRTDVRVDGPRGIKDCFTSGNIEVIDAVSANTYSQSVDDRPVYGGPVYCDVVADIKRHPGIEKVINNFIYDTDLDLNGIYKYVCYIKNIDANAVSVNLKAGVVKVFNMGFSNNIILSNKEKEIANLELKIIFESIFDCFTVKDIKTKNVVNGHLAITTEITIEELKKLKEDLVLAKSNGEIVASEVMMNLFGDNYFAKQKNKTKANKVLESVNI